MNELDRQMEQGSVGAPGGPDDGDGVPSRITVTTKRRKTKA